VDEVTLHTARCELSTPRASDVDDIFAACQDADTQRFTTIPVPYLREHAEEFVARSAQLWDEGTEATWAIRVDGSLAGMMGLHRPGEGSAELGYWLAPHARGAGLTVEAATAVIDWAFATDGWGLARVEWRASTANPASAHVARALGFRFEGTLRSQMVTGDGVRHDAWVAGLLRTDDRTPVAWPDLAA
jgi:RimJ/RimL family protein N-acetyltransferase